MISAYETSAAQIAGEHELSTEELAKYSRQELPGLVADLLSELVDRFDLHLGLLLSAPGIQVSSVDKLPAYCRFLLANPETGDRCRATHSPQQEMSGSPLEPQGCYAGVKYDSITFSIRGLGQATLFGDLAPGASRPADEVKEAIPSPEKLQHLSELYSSLGDRSSRLAPQVVLEVSAFLLKKFLEDKVQNLSRSRTENLAKQMFLHEAAHGIAAVESAFLGLEDMLRPYVDEFSQQDKEDVRKFFSVLKREYQIHRMALLNLLEYYHPAAYAEMQKSAIAVCNPTEILRDLLPLYKPLAQARNVRLDEDLQNWHEMPRMRLDRAAMTRAFHNVLWNAIKYSYQSIVNPTGPTNRFIRVSCRPLYNPGQRGEGRECSIEVENYGLGIKPEEISRVTQPAFRGEAAVKEKTLGSGLGLYETERIVRNHGGRLRIVSKQVHADTYLTRVILIIPYRTTLA